MFKFYLDEAEFWLVSAPLSTFDIAKLDIKLRVSKESGPLSEEPRKLSFLSSAIQPKVQF